MFEKDKLEDTKKILDSVSNSMCLAKWFQTTLYLQNGYNHSCHHPSPHKIPIFEIKQNFKALHNTSFKKQKMQEMLDGTRPSECEYCWKIEDLGKNHISDRVYKSATSWAMPRLQEALEKRTNDIEPGYLEVSFSNVCNFKCVYCSPEISSLWYKEIDAHGPYPTSMQFNNFDYLRNTERLPYDPNGFNPYVEAFWKWWPELYPKLHTLRLTGGEPLLSRDVWKILDFVIQNPQPHLTFCINSNLCVQEDLIDKLISKINQLEGKIKEIQIFSSGEATGIQAEYIRFGLNYDKWLINMEKIAHNCKNVLLATMTTVNLLSVPSFSSFIDHILDLRNKFNPLVNFNKIQFMVNYLRYPKFLSLPILDDATKEAFSISIKKLIEKRCELSFAEKDQLERLVEYMWTSDNDVNLQRTDFCKFVDEIDKRRNLNFKSTFPDLINFYNLCQKS